MQSFTPYLTPLAIILGFGMLAVAIYLSGTNVSPTVQAPVGAAPTAPTEPTPPGPQVALKADLDEDEYIYGNPDAEVFIIEYSDIDCPFCARLHPTLKQVVDASDGEIAWVYRHFPLEQLHPDAARKAAATECVGKLAGNDAFWPYLDGLVQQASTDTYVDYSINEADFSACMESGTAQAAVEADLNRALESGGRGTPYSIVATLEEGVPISGAQPATVWVQAAGAISGL